MLRSSVILTVSPSRWGSGTFEEDALLNFSILRKCEAPQRDHFLDAVMGRRLMSSQLGGCPSE